MHYEELPGPLEGWTYDEEGTIYTTSGYRCSAQQIEFAMWMWSCMTAEAKHWMIRSDERPGATRPLFDPEDLKSESAGKGKKPEREAVSALRAQATATDAPQ